MGDLRGAFSAVSFGSHTREASPSAGVVSDLRPTQQCPSPQPQTSAAVANGVVYFSSATAMFAYSTNGTQLRSLAPGLSGSPVIANGVVYNNSDSGNDSNVYAYSP